MNVETLVNPTPEGESGVVSSLSEIKARLAARRERDLSKLPTHYHEALGTIHIGFLPSEGYHAIEAAEIPQEAWATGTDHAWPPEAIQKNIDEKRDRAYLRFGVITGDNKRLDDETIGLLLTGDYGAENRKLINAIKEKNPPREYLAFEVERMFACSQWTCILFEILERAGCLKQLRDFMLTDADSVEGKALAEDLQKWESVLPEFKALMSASDLAKRIGVTVYEREPKETE